MGSASRSPGLAVARSGARKRRTVVNCIVSIVANVIEGVEELMLFSREGKAFLVTWLDFIPVAGRDTAKLQSLTTPSAIFPLTGGQMTLRGCPDDPLYCGTSPYACDLNRQLGGCRSMILSLAHVRQHHGGGRYVIMPLGRNKSDFLVEARWTFQKKLRS